MPLAGPGLLSPAAMARILAEVLERPVRFQELPIEAHPATLLEHGSSEAWAQSPVDMAMAQNNGAHDEEQCDAPPAPTGFRAWCEEVLRPAFLKGPEGASPTS